MPGWKMLTTQEHNYPHDVPALAATNTHLSFPNSYIFVLIISCFMF